MHMPKRRNAREETNAAQKWIEKALVPLALIGCLLGLIDGAITAVVKVGQLLSTQRLLTMSALWLAAVLISWRGIPPRRQLLGFRGSVLRITLITLVSLLFAFLAIYPEARNRWFDEGPAKNPNLSPVGSMSVGVAYAASSSPFAIERVYINDELSSFEETSGYQLGKKRFGSKIRTFAYNERVKAARENGRCISAEGDRQIVNVLPLLQERIQRLNRPDLKRLVADVNSYRAMMSRSGGHFSEVVFTQLEINRMRQSDPEAFEIVSRWLVDCVGVQNPVLTIEVRNLSSKVVLLTELHYLVDDAYTVLGGESGPLTPAYTYDHTLPHAPGSHRRPLVPSFSLAPQSLGAFNVVIRAAQKGAGQAWVLRLRLVDSRGNQETSPPFQLIMSKLEN
jgi:hypothetical protein